jgi:hypothetical protein
MRSVYNRCISYAHKLDPISYKDLVSDAWLYNFKREGTDLFDKHPGYAMKCVKYIWLSNDRKQRYMYEGELYRYQFHDPENFIIKHHYTPDREITTEYFYKELHKRVDAYRSKSNCSLDPRILRRFLDLLDSGLTIKEISEEMEMSVKRLHYYKNKLKTIVNEINEAT